MGGPAGGSALERASPPRAGEKRKKDVYIYIYIYILIFEGSVAKDIS